MKIHFGDNYELLKQMPDNSIDAVVTDPPYGLGKEPDALAMLQDWLETGHHDVKGRGFMGKKWDAFVPQPRQWREIYRVLKPGGHVLAFAGTRTQDLMALGLRLAGFEIRDLVAWVYAQGFPKSMNVGCKCGGGALPYAHEEALPGKPKTECDLHPMRNVDVSPPVDSIEGRGQVLQSSLSESGASTKGREQLPAAEVRSRQSIMEGRCDLLAEEGQLQTDQICPMPFGVSTDGPKGWIRHGTPPDSGADDGTLPDARGGCPSSESRSARQQTGELRTIPKQRGAQEGGRRTCPTCKGIIGAEGFGTALKPALEPITLARKPLEGTVAKNVLKWHTGAINVDGCRVGDEVRYNAPEGNKAGGSSYNMSVIGMPKNAEGRNVMGRWPANLIHDGSDEVVAMFPQSRAGTETQPRGKGGIWTPSTGTPAGPQYGDTGSAARFFYCAKVSPSERNAGLAELPDKEWKADGAAIPQRADRPFTPSKNNHPTVKPIALMRYLCRLITPPGGTVLDPWMGSGSTGVACKEEGFQFIGMEQDEGYHAIACARCGVQREEEPWV